MKMLTVAAGTITTRDNTYYVAYLSTEWAENRAECPLYPWEMTQHNFQVEQ